MQPHLLVTHHIHTYVSATDVRIINLLYLCLIFDGACVLIYPQLLLLKITVVVTTHCQLIIHHHFQ